MTVLSQVNAERFANLVRTIFPENRIFDPIDYWDVFNSRRDIPLGKHTFKKYLSIICDSTYFPGLSRVRDNSTAPYRYFVDKTGEAVTNLSRSAVRASSEGKQGLSPSISDESLINFAKKIEPLMTLGTWYLPATLTRKYNNRYKKHLRPDTLKDYMSQSFRRGLWGRLERKAGRRNALSYRVHTALSFQEKSTQTSTTKNVVQEKGTDSSSHSGVICALALPCRRCTGENPEVARFCMHCGEGLRISLKVVMQESVFTVPVNMAGLTTPKHLNDLVRTHIARHAEVVVVNGDSAGEKVYAVTVKE